MRCGIPNQRAANSVRGVLVGALLVMLVSCAQRGVTKAAAPVVPAAPKPVAPPPPPPAPLSSPQTHVDLPKPQPIDDAALETEAAPAEAPAATRTPAPKRTTVVPVAPPRPWYSRRSPRETIQEIIAAGGEAAAGSSAGAPEGVEQILAQPSRRRLTQAQHAVMTNIRNFLALSDEAEKAQRYASGGCARGAPRFWRRTYRMGNNDYEARRQGCQRRTEGTQAGCYCWFPSARISATFLVSGSNGALLMLPGKNILFTDPRYQIQAAQESTCQVRIVKVRC